MAEKLFATPLSLKEANEYVAKLHRHHSPVKRDKFRFGCTDKNHQLHGIIQLGRPVSRILDDGKTIEVVRCCTDGTFNACSFLYSRAARIAKEMGYSHIITYILQNEDGMSLKASGWNIEAEKAGGGEWNKPSRPRPRSFEEDLFGNIIKKYDTQKKQRWGKYFSEKNV